MLTCNTKSAIVLYLLSLHLPISEWIETIAHVLTPVATNPTIKTTISTAKLQQVLAYTQAIAIDT